MGQVLFSDNVFSNNPIRQENIKTLESAGFVHGGIFSRSGELHLVEKATKYQLVFGVRSNISGKKYFSMAKDFASKQEAENFAKQLNLKSK